MIVPAGNPAERRVKIVTTLPRSRLSGAAEADFYKGAISHVLDLSMPSSSGDLSPHEKLHVRRLIIPRIDWIIEAGRSSHPSKNASKSHNAPLPLHAAPCLKKTLP